MRRLTLPIAAFLVALALAPTARGLNPQIAGLQIALRERGLYPEPIDAVQGPKTVRAVRTFQRRHRLVVDGIAGPRTLTALGLTGRRPSARGAAGVLERIARCESGGNPRAVSANGRYFGKYQFSRATWSAVGGRGNPARASEAEQDRRALILYRRHGAAPWPACGRR